MAYATVSRTVVRKGVLVRIQSWPLKNMLSKLELEEKVNCSGWVEQFIGDK